MSFAPVYRIPTELEQATEKNQVFSATTVVETLSTGGKRKKKKYWQGYLLVEESSWTEPNISSISDKKNVLPTKLPALQPRFMEPRTKMF